MSEKTAEERAAAIKLYVYWTSKRGYVRSWDDVRADIAKAIRVAERVAVRAALAKRKARALR